MDITRRTLLKSATAGAGLLAAGRWAHAAPARRDEALAMLESSMRAHLEAWGLPGMTLCFVDGENTGVLSAGLADLEQRSAVTPDHLFQIGSISKSFVGLSILRAAEAGRVSLATPVHTLLPEARLPVNAGITVRHLLNHSSGLPDNTPLHSRAIDGLWVGYEPGTHWSYSNTGYVLLGLLLEKVEGRPLVRILEDGVLQELGMRASRGTLQSIDRTRYATGYSPLLRDRPWPARGSLGTAAWVDSTDGAGCIASTPADMARYLRWLVAAARGRGAPVLSDGGARDFTRLTQDAPDWSPGARYALGLALVPDGKRMLLHHTGGMVAYSSSLHVDAEAGVGCFASTNAGMIDYRPRALTLYACRLLRALRERRPLPEPPPPFPGVADAATYPGLYRDAAGRSIALRVEEDKLLARIDGADAEVQPGAGGLLLVHPDYALMPLFVARSGAQVTSLWYGERQYAKDGIALSNATVPQSLAALAGRYDNDDPWEGVMRIVARPDGLYAWGTEKLSPLPDGGFRHGEHAWSPERIRFDAELAGRIRRLDFSGTDFIRRDD